MNTDGTHPLPDGTGGIIATFGAGAEVNETDNTEGHGHGLGGVFASWEPDKKVVTQQSGVLRP